MKLILAFWFAYVVTALSARRFGRLAPVSAKRGAWTQSRAG